MVTTTGLEKDVGCHRVLDVFYVNLFDVLDVFCVYVFFDLVRMKWSYLSIEPLFFCSCNLKGVGS